MISSDPTNNRTYRIELDSSKEAEAFGNCLILTENRNGKLPITLYLSQKAVSVNGIDFDNLNKGWVSITGIEPIPSFNKIESKVSQ